MSEIAKRKFDGHKILKSPFLTIKNSANDFQSFNES
jgi:hypothetical protein